MSRSFGAVNNPYENILDDKDIPIFSENFEEHHVIPQDIFKDDGSPDYNDSRAFLKELGFDGTDFDRNGLFVPANERDALIVGSGMHRGPHPLMTGFVDKRIIEVRDQRDREQLRLTSQYISEGFSILEAQSKAAVEANISADRDINRIIGAIPELLQKLDANDNPLAVLNNSDPRASNSATAIMAKLEQDYKLYEPDGSGGFKVGDKFAQLNAYADPSYRGLLNFDEDGKGNWTDRQRATIISRQILVVSDIDANRDIDFRGAARRADTDEFKTTVDRTEGFIRELNAVDPDADVNTAQQLESKFQRTFRNSLVKMREYADYTITRAKLVLDAARDAGDRVPDFAKFGLRKADEFFRKEDGSAVGFGNIARYASGDANGWEDEIYIDHFQPWMIYGFERDEDGNLDMYITNAFEQLFRGFNAIFSDDDPESLEGVHRGWMKIENVDVVGSRLGALQFAADNEELSNGKLGGSLNMVFRAGRRPAANDNEPRCGMTFHFYSAMGNAA